MRNILLAIALLLCSFSLNAQERQHIDTIWLSHMYTTHIVFPAEVTYIDKSSPQDVKVQVLEQNRNMVRIKAARPFDGSSSLSVLESNGNIHTFFLKYAEKPDVLIVDVAKLGQALPAAAAAVPAPQASSARRSREEADAAPKEEKAVEENNASGPVRGNVAPTLSDVLSSRQHLYHIGDTQFGLCILVENILVYNDVTFVVVSLKNDSAISYAAADPSFTVESRRKSRRNLEYSNDLHPRSRLGSLFAQSGGVARAVYCFDKITLTREQVLRMYVYEDQGQRNFVITLSADDINHAARYVQQ